jgi:Caspase domain
MRWVVVILLAIWTSGLFGQPALADKRVALIIGNSKYQNVNQLTNPANDAAMLADTFRKANFDTVMLRYDLTATKMRRALREFADKAHDATVAVLYFAGHGIEVDGNNYLIPVDAVLERDTDVYDEAIGLERVLVAVEPAKQLRLIILDACRDNPFAKTMKRTVASRGIGQGLAKVEPASPNTMIAFAAKAGFTAADGDGKDSPFAMALANHLTTPGLDLRKAFGFVRDDVLKATRNRQEPFTYGSLGGEDVALVPAPPKAAPAADANEAIRRDYELAERVGTREAWDFFMATYPNGFYSKLAQAQRDKLAAEAARIAATEKAKAAAEENARLAAEQAKAIAEAKAAGEARVAAGNRKAIEDARLAEAERAKAAAQAKPDQEAKHVAEKRAMEAAKAEAAAKSAEEARIAAETAAQARIAKAEEEARAAAEKAKAATAARAAEEARVAELTKELEEAKAAEAARAKAAAQAGPANKHVAKPIGQLAAVAPSGSLPDARPPVDIPRLLLTELRRVGCFTGSIDGNWNDAAQQSLARFNKYAGTTLDIKLASLDTLDLVRGKTERICPLICEHGYQAEGETCTKIICKAGFELNGDNECTRIQRTKQETRPEQRSLPRNGPPSAGGGNGGGGCKATSCSMAMRGCMRKAAMFGHHGHGCEVRYDNCLRTGGWSGRMCDMHGLAKN